MESRYRAIIYMMIIKGSIHGIIRDVVIIYVYVLYILRLRYNLNDYMLKLMEGSCFIMSILKEMVIDSVKTGIDVNVKANEVLSRVAKWVICEEETVIPYSISLVGLSLLIKYGKDYKAVSEDIAFCVEGINQEYMNCLILEYTDIFTDGYVHSLEDGAIEQLLELHGHNDLVTIFYELRCYC